MNKPTSSIPLTSRRIYQATRLALAAISTIAATSGLSQAADLRVAAGTEQVISSTTRLTALDLGTGAKLAAPKGKSLTLTIDGVGTAIRAGYYSGNIVLSVTDDILIKYQNLEAHHFRSGAYIENGKYQPNKSVSAIVVGGQVTDTAAKDISIRSNEENFNGVLVAGTSTYRIDNPKIHFVGNGGNDFAGYGAAIAARDKSTVTVNKADIQTEGSIRGAVFVGGDSKLTVNDTLIQTYNGSPHAAGSIAVGIMAEVPWVLGLSGTVRATNIVGNGTATYNNSTIRSQGWGAMSTDDTNVVRLYMNNSTVETIESGYGAYSIGDTQEIFNHTTFNVADVALIMAAEGSGTFTNGSVVNSRRLGVMMHSDNGGTLTIDKGSVFNTKATAIQVKGRGANIVVDNARLNAENNIILQAMENDDPMATGMMSMPGMPAPGGGIQGGPGMPSGPATPAVGEPGGPPMPAGPAPGTKKAGFTYSDDVTAVFSNVTLKGDLLNARTMQGNMHITLKNGSLTGAISTATAKPAKEGVPVRENYKFIGEVSNTLAESKEKFGLALTLGDKASWIVDRTSYLTRLTVTDTASIKAPAGRTVSLLVNGVNTPIKAGNYSGKITLQVQ